MCDTLDQLFDFGKAPEFKPNDMMPSAQQRQRQAGESQKGSNKKHNTIPSISELAENTSGKSNNCNNSGTSKSKSGKSNKSSGGSHASFSPTPWLSNKVYQSRNANRQCTQCGSADHKTHLCTEPGKSNPPDQNSSDHSTYEGQQIKRQKSFDMQQLKNQFTSLNM